MKIKTTDNTTSSEKHSYYQKHVMEVGKYD
ncbi:hypothetical protein DFP81_101505 [Marinomonas pollencensis]|uniref:Uncharacterized protein n=1 Tax=Marinomonas pollencensis TaxID=491954 RepID=A0A3E0DVS7_9GAMM|nr:hypothetical protein DFP81_101505 [Marinomonas pollencensis]